MRVRVLGPLEVRTGGRQVAIAGPLPRRLLALLVTRPGQFVPVGALIDGLWGNGPPAAARATLQSHVARLRRSLGESGVVAGGPAGYRLAVDAADVDAFAFVAAVQAGHRALAGGNLLVAAAELSAGLALWRGPAFAEFGGCAALGAEAARLEQLRLDAVEWRIEAELASADRAPPVGDLEALVREHPTREGLWALLMRALYRAGRQADALEAYRRARRALVDELGVEPGPQLREVERLVLAQDPSLDAPVAVALNLTVFRASQAAVPAWESAQAAETGLSAERRVVVVAMVELPGGTADPEDTEARNRSFRDHLRARIAAHGGIISAHAGGSSAAIFGATVAHDDDVMRAISAARAVIGGWPGVPAPRAGVSAGEVLVTGDVGVTAEVPAGAVSGLPLTEADRLRALARPGDLVIDEPVRYLIGTAADAEPVPGAQPRAWRLIGLAAPRAGPAVARFVGRHRDLAVLRAAFDKTAGERTPQLVTILGEAGIGKSRLVAELKRALETQDGEVLWQAGRCRPYGDVTSLSALADIVKAHAGITDTDTTAAAAAKIRAALPDEERDDLEPRLTPLVGVDPGITQSRFESFSAWRRFIEIIAEGAPTVLAIEDLHWAAPLLLDFLEDLAAGLSDVPVLVIATARPELLDARPSWGAGTASVRLSPLPEREISAMLDALLGPAPDAGSRGALAARCGGVPLYAEEFARLASQQGGAAAVPPTLAAVIGARLDTLSREHRAVLQSAAVAGRAFWADEVGVLTGTSAEKLAAALGVLMRRQFLRRITPSTRAGHAEFTFWHDLVRDAAEARLTRLDRARRHLAVARWWQADAGERSDGFADLIAHHAGTAYDLASAAGDAGLAAQARGPACAAAAAAGARLLGIDTPGALRLLARALELSDQDSPLRARVLCWHGTALCDDRQFELAEQVLTEAVQELERINDPLRVDAIIALTLAVFALGHDWAPTVRAALRAAETLPPSREAARNLGTLAMSELVGQNPQSLQNAIGLADRAIAIAARHGTGGDALAHVVRGRARVGLGDGGGMEELESGLDDVQRYEPGSMAVAARNFFAGALHHFRGPAAELKARQEIEALAASRGLQVVTSLAIAENVRVLHELGRFGEAIALAEQIHEEEVEAQLRWGAVQRALALLDTGALDERTVEAVRRIPPADEGDLRHVLGVALVRAAAAIRRGRADEAVTLLRLLGDLQPFSERDGGVELLPRLVRTAIAAGCPETVTGLRDLAAVPTPLRLRIAATVAGLIEEICGRPAAAAERLRDAASGWEALDYRVEAAFTSADLARNLRTAGDPTAKSAVEHAKLLCSDLGLVLLLHMGA